MNITETISKELTAGNDLPNFKAGDNITVYYTIKEGEKQRTQFFKGDVIQRKGIGATETFASVCPKQKCSQPRFRTQRG